MPNIGNNFDDFVNKVSEAIRKTLNTETGQDITTELLKLKLTENPQLTAEEWKATKSDFMTWLFCQFVMECPDAKKEIAQHVWDELQKES